MRKAPLFAGIAQLLNGIFAIAPEVFGLERAPVRSQVFDWAFSSFMLVGSTILAIFFFMIVTTAAPNVGGPVRIASLAAAAALTVENLFPSYTTILGAVAAANNSLGWKYHPLKQFVFVFVPTIPTLEVISLVVFLLVVFSISSKTSDWTQSPKDRTSTLSFVSLAAAALGFIAAAFFLYSVIFAPRPLASSVLRLVLRFATLVSLIAFFFVFGMNQQRGNSGRGALAAGSALRSPFHS
jgi:hypothetical protein